ncbi:hypothetical protein [Clostridiisalibacter paucivorans]|uniref:hypothetical protein n=1 Tax=Clostridiisalibacter paucivorans TaxID=408753 RepID=UPI000478C90B|nr:hypothetical protein [Clostridiisalibacter paucivorans]
MENQRPLDMVKNLYDKGFKCIKYEEDENQRLKVYFKNFETEKIDDLTLYNVQSIKDVKEFVDNQYQG